MTTATAVATAVPPDDVPAGHRPDVAAPTEVITVLLADGHRLFRSALAALLDREADLSVVAEAAWGDDVLRDAQVVRPSVALLDLDLPGTPALDVASQLHDHVPLTRVLLLTAYARPADVKRALADGVDGVLLKDLAPDRLLGAVRTLAAGGQVYEPSLVVDAVRARPGGPTPGSWRYSAWSPTGAASPKWPGNSPCPRARYAITCRP